MLYLIKTLLSAIIIVAVTEASKLNPQLGGLIKSLPLISVISFIWLYHDTGDTKVIADLSISTLWYVLPTLPMFYIFAVLLNKGISFYIAFSFSIITIFPLYYIASKFV